MSNASTITVSITPEGDVSVKSVGIKGKSCKDVTRAIEEALGETVKDVATSEYNEQPVRTALNRR